MVSPKFAEAQSAVANMVVRLRAEAVSAKLLTGFHFLDGYYPDLLRWV